MDEIQRLNSDVTAAILEAERLENAKDPEAVDAYRKVLEFEIKLAEDFPPYNAEGMFARRGAVHAAIKCGEIRQAEELVEQYCADERIGHGEKQNFLAILTTAR